MRIPVLSFCIVLSLFLFFSASRANAQNENLPKYANERFYPKGVTEKQQEGGFIYDICSAVGGFGIFECEGLRTYEVITPESMSITQEDINQNQQASDLQALVSIEKELVAATTSAQVLGVMDAFNNLVDRIFGGSGESTGFIDSYRPADTAIGNPGDTSRIRIQKLQMALRPASMQNTQTDPAVSDRDGDGIPDDIDVDPDVPDPDAPEPTFGPQPAPTGNSGYDLVQGIKAACRYNGTPGRVHETNTDCLYNVSPRLAFNALPELRNSALAYTNLQCVGFVLGMNLQFKGKSLDNGGNAIDFATNIPTGYRLVSRSSLVTTPKVGDLLLWNIGAFGHIAYIVNVHDTNYVDIIEANWGTLGTVGFRTVNVRAGDILGWLTQ